MSEVVRQSTARTVMVGPILDASGVAVTDGVVGDLKVSKNGAAPAALNGSATLTHRHTGHYSLSLATADVDTVGTAQITIDDTVNAMPPKELTVIEEAVYDALYAASAPGYLQPATAGRTLVVDAAGLADANVVKLGPTGSGTAQTARDLGANIDATVSSRASQTSVDTVDDFLDTELAATLAAVDTEVAAILVDTNELQTDWTNGGRLDLLIDSILADTNELQTDWVNGGRLDNILDARASQTSVDTVDDFLDTEMAATLAAVDTEVAAVLAAVDTEVAAIKVVTDALGATAAARLKLSAETMLPGTVDTTAFSPTTTQFEADDITEATADHFNGRIVIFTSGALQYQASDITDYSLVSGRGRFVVTAMTEAAGNNDTFIIV